MRYNILLLFIILLPLNAECMFEHNILYALAKNEHHPKRKIGYPYLISLNNQNEARIVRETGSAFEWLDNRTIDCHSEEECIKISKILIANRIVNIDLGAFQINYKWHPEKLENFFILTKSYDRACEILADLKNKYGWNWTTLGQYHMVDLSTEERKKKNQEYYTNLQKTILELTNVETN